jgi:hypothetical protein
MPALAGIQLWAVELELKLGPGFGRGGGASDIENTFTPIRNLGVSVSHCLQTFNFFHLGM